MATLYSLGDSDLLRVCETSHFDYNIHGPCCLQTVFTGLDHHQKDAVFATCGQQVDIWDEQRSSPIRSFTWGVDSFSAVRFNPVEVKHHAFTTLRQAWSCHRGENALPSTICPSLNSHQSDDCTAHKLSPCWLYLKWIVYFATDRTSCKLCLWQKYSTVWHERIGAT